MRLETNQFQRLEAAPDHAWLLTNTLVPLVMVSRKLFQDPISFMPDSDGRVIIDIPPHVSHVSWLVGTVALFLAVRRSV